MSSNTNEEEFVEISDGIKSIPIKQLEECIALAVSKEINGSKLNCHINEIKTNRMHGVQFTIQITNNLDDVGF